MIKLAKNFYRYNFRFGKAKVLSRVACLGQNILDSTGTSSLFNHQKSRVDYLLDRCKPGFTVSDYKEIYSLLNKKYIFGAIQVQKYDFFKYSIPDLIVMDSYAELTDQLFVKASTNTKFLANYSDVNNDKLTNAGYECHGLLDLEYLEDSYDRFFSQINLKYPNVPVIFIHFSAALDEREKFKIRAAHIESAVSNLASKYKFLIQIKVPDNLIFKSDDPNDSEKDFPYHYSQITYLNYQKAFNNLIT